MVFPNPFEMRDVLDLRTPARPAGTAAREGQPPAAGNRLQAGAPLLRKGVAGGCAIAKISGTRTVQKLSLP